MEWLEAGMAKYKVAELEGDLLDAAVAKANGWVPNPNYPDRVGCWYPPSRKAKIRPNVDQRNKEFKPSTNWVEGGEIIERELIDIESGLHENGGATGTCWTAFKFTNDGDVAAECKGTTPLQAAMRAYVISRLGEEIELP